MPDDKPELVRKMPCEVYSRIVGYLRPVANWNKGKQQEFADRRNYKIQEEPTSGKDDD